MPSEDRGATLLELVIAVAIMGVTMLAILGGFATTILMSGIHREQATAGTVAREYAEAVQSTVAAGGFVETCGSSMPYALPVSVTAPTDYDASLSSMRYWTAGAWSATCDPAAGLQRLTVEVAGPGSRATEQVTVVLRKPCRTGDAPCS